MNNDGAALRQLNEQRHLTAEIIRQ